MPLNVKSLIRVEGILQRGASSLYTGLVNLATTPSLYVYTDYGLNRITFHLGNDFKIYGGCLIVEYIKS